VIINKKK